MTALKKCRRRVRFLEASVRSMRAQADRAFITDNSHTRKAHLKEIIKTADSALAPPAETSSI